MKAALLVLGAALALPAQQQLTVEQLVSFIRSSIELRQSDKEVADYLRNVQLTQKLDARTVEELQGLGAGPKTVEALNRLVEASKDLPGPPPPARKPAPAPIPPPSAEEQKQIIEAVRKYALSYTKTLPDFICTQVTRRYIDPTGLEFWQRQDVITAQLNFFEGREDYKVVLINNRVANVSYDELGGATSTGEFGSMLRELFEPETETRFRWERWATLRGRRTHVYSYQVEQRRSKWRISYQKKLEIVPAYGGLVYIDAGTLAVARITLEAIGIPPSFPIQQASTVLDYDFTEIAGNQYWVPLKAVVRMREGKFLVKNEVEFRRYRKFTADATVISFDTPEPLPEEKTSEQPPR